MSSWRIAIVSPALVLVACLNLSQADPAEIIGSQFVARDTFAMGEEPNADARQCLTNLSWPRGEFLVRICAPAKPDREDRLVRFPSPLSQHEDAAADVVLEWYMPRDAAGNVISSPAVVVIHESGRSMPVGRTIAKGFRARGLHAFLLQLPGYGERRPLHVDSKANLMTALKQGITDARRARDAVAALPTVKGESISLQGTSLGSFVASTVAGLDRGYESVFLLLSGGDIFSIIQKGARDAAKVREVLAKGGLSEDDVRELAWQIEPLRLAHRIDAEHTWLFSGVFDTVIPIENARMLAKAADLSEGHHILMPVDHYLGILLLPAVLDQMTATILGIPVDQVPSPLNQAK